MACGEPEDDDTIPPADGSQCIELDSHSGETGCEIFVSKSHFDQVRLLRNCYT